MSVGRGVVVEELLPAPPAPARFGSTPGSIPIRVAGKDLFGVKDSDLQRLRAGQEIEAKYIVDANGQLRLISVNDKPNPA